MAPNLPDSPALHLVLGAMRAGSIRLVDIDAQPLTFEGALNQPCWAHLRDAADGQVYVHELPGSRDLLQERYQQLLGLSV